VAVFRIPGPLRTLSGGESTVTVDAQDLRAAIDELDSKFPGFKGRLLDEEGQPRQFVNLFLNEEDVRLRDGLDSRVGERDEIAIVPAVAGGSSGPGH
jgi:molybdopterin converting factor small subunit